MSTYIDHERIYWATCDECGWAGEPTASRQAADLDGQTHEKNHHERTEDE